MQLLELEVENWRGLTGKLGPFSATLNLICGPNESGKSRFFQALRFALFESHKGSAQHKKDLQSWTSAETPLVRLSFEKHGTRYTLTKRYLKNAFAELSGDGQTLKDEEAEARLLELTGARNGGSRETSEADMGIWPLLMIAQGESRRLASDALNSDSHSHLQDLLSEEIGTSAVSASGKKLLEFAAAERDRYYTPTGQEKPLLKQARARCEDAREAVRLAQDNYQNQVSTATELADVRRQLSELTPRLEAAREQAKAFRQKAEAANAARADRDSKLSARELAKNRKDNAESSLNGRKAEEDELQAAEAVLRTKREKLAELREQEESLAKELSQKEDAAQRALDARDATKGQLKAAQKQAQAKQIQEEIKTLQVTIKALETNESQAAELRKQRAKLVEVNEEQLGKLRELEQQFKLSKAQLDGAAMRVGITAHQAISVNGNPLGSGGQREILITDREKISLDGIADIDVRPQQGSLDELKSAVESSEQELKDALDALGLDSVGGAAKAENAWSTVSRQIENLEREAEYISARPLATLKEELARLQLRSDELGEIEGSIDLGAAEEAAEAAQQVVERTQSERNVTDKLLSKQRSTLAVEESTVAQLDEQQAARRSKLESMPAIEQLEADFVTAQQGLANAQVALDEATQRFEALGGEQVSDDARRLERAAVNLEKEQTETSAKLSELTGSLGILMKSGSYEQVQDSLAELELASAELQRLERDAGAAKRLHEVLSAKQQELVDRLTAPVIKRIQPYLADIFPGSSVQHGDRLDFTGLQSSNLKEDFQALSGGAQEQFSLMTRIGLAEVLAEEHRLPLVLDDSLVNSDADRIKRVHRALDRASERLQIIVFTCHEVLFDALGAEFRQRLSATRVPSHAVLSAD